MYEKWKQSQGYLEDIGRVSRCRAGASEEEERSERDSGRYTKRYGVPDEKARKWETRGGRREGARDHLTSSGGSGSSSKVVRTLRMERPVSGRLQDAGERKKDVPDATPD